MRHKSNILVVDDNEDLVKTLQERLEFEGFEIDVAFDGKQAMELVKSKKPDLIILDLMMPQVSGITVLDSLQFGDETKSIPIIVMSALDSPETQEHVKQIGAQAFLAKPCDEEVLIKKIKELI